MELKVGDKVVYSRLFLHNIQDYSAESANMIGTIKEIKGYNHGVRIASIQWEGQPFNKLRSMNVNSLWPADKIHLEPR